MTIRSAATETTPTEPVLAGPTEPGADKDASSFRPAWSDTSFGGKPGALAIHRSGTQALALVRNEANGVPGTGIKGVLYYSESSGFQSLPFGTDQSLAVPSDGSSLAQLSAGAWTAKGATETHIIGATYKVESEGNATIGIAFYSWEFGNLSTLSSYETTGNSGPFKLIASADSGVAWPASNRTSLDFMPDRRGGLFLLLMSKLSSGSQGSVLSLASANLQSLPDSTALNEGALPTVFEEGALPTVLESESGLNFNDGSLSGTFDAFGRLHLSTSHSSDSLRYDLYSPGQGEKVTVSTMGVMSLGSYQVPPTIQVTKSVPNALPMGTTSLT